MLGAGGHATRLDASHIPCSHLARKQRILREVLEVAPAEGASLDAEPGTQHDVHALVDGLLAKRATQLFGKRGIPAVSDRHRRGKAGRRHGAANAQMIGRIGALVTHAVRAIRKLQLRDAQTWVGARTERRHPREQRALLRQVHLVDDIVMSESHVGTSSQSVML